MSQQGIKRRQFLKTSGGVAMGAAAAGSGLIALSGSRTAAAMTLSTLSEHEGQTLLGMTRQLYPHDSLADIYYASLVNELDSEAKNNPDTAALLSQGVTDLDAALGIPWLELSDGNQLSVLRSMEFTPFFAKVKSKTVVSLYNNPLVWRHFGFEGESFSKGGYINRGFNDLTWLPDPPAEASPPAA